MTTDRRRGRPRGFDPDVVLERAIETFLRFGYAGASLDALAGAMGLNKPSIYAAFGDKRQLFQRCLEARAESLAGRYRQALQRGRTLESALRAMFEEAVDIYLGEGGPPGCLIASASTTEAVVDDDLARFTRTFFETCDRLLGDWVAGTYAEVPPATARALGALANGVLHDLALRARVGEPRPDLRRYARDAAATLAASARREPSPKVTPRRPARTSNATTTGR